MESGILMIFCHSADGKCQQWNNSLGRCKFVEKNWMRIGNQLEEIEKLQLDICWMKYVHANNDQMQWKWLMNKLFC
jgi:hypothetical protein